MKVLFTAAEIAALALPDLPHTKRGVNKRAKLEAWPCEARLGQGGGSQYHVSSLPEAARVALVKRELQPVAAAPAPELLAALADDERAQSRASARAELVRAGETFRLAAGLPKARGRELFAAAYNAGEIAVPAWVRSQVPSVSPNSLFNWATAFQREGAARLAGRYGRHRKGTGRIDRDAEIAETIKALLTDHPHASAKHVMQALRARFTRDRLPSFRRLQAWLKQWKESNPQLFAAIQNPDAWRSRYLAASGSASEAVTELNQLWEIDSTPADVILADGRRHAIIGVIDVYSRRLKLRVERTSRSTAIAALLRAAMLDWGVPQAVKTDNGSDYRSKHLTLVFAGLDIHQELCPPFTPQAKPHIERAFGTFSHGLIELAPGFIGHNVAERKAIEARRSFAERMFKKGVDPMTLLMTAEELQAFCDAWCERHYHHEPHSGLGRKTPFQVATEWRGEIRRIGNDRALDILLAEAPGDGGWRVVGKKGIAVEGTQFDAVELGPLAGRRVRVKLDEADAGRVYVFDDEGKFVAIAIAPEREGIARKEIAQRKRAHQKRVIAEQRKALKALAREHKTANIVSEIIADSTTHSASLVAFPARATEHSTEPLEEAARAAAAVDGPRVVADLTDEQRALADAKWRELTGEPQPIATVIELRPQSSARPHFENDKEFALWVLENPQAATDEDRARLDELLASKSFRLWIGYDDRQGMAG